VTFAHLNLAITFASAIDLSSIYCGGPDNPDSDPGDAGYPPFDYCAVMDPNQPASGPETFSNQALAGNLIHQFVEENGDTPSNFYNNNFCFFGCSPDIGPYPGSTVFLSFNVGGQHPQTGLFRGDTFQITLGCTAPIEEGPEIESETEGDPNCSDDLFKNATFAFNVDSNQSSTQFPTVVPEPATITFFALAGIPALLRRRKKS
jgi:hypothetical protein